jgi:hypothetical protein
MILSSSQFQVDISFLAVISARECQLPVVWHERDERRIRWVYETVGTIDLVVPLAAARLDVKSRSACRDKSS